MSQDKLVELRNAWTQAAKDLAAKHAIVRAAQDDLNKAARDTTNLVGNSQCSEKAEE